MRLAEKVSNGLQQVSLAEDSGPQRTTLGGLKRQGKKGTVGTKRTGNATLCKLLHKASASAALVNIAMSLSFDSPVTWIVTSIAISTLWVNLYSFVLFVFVLLNHNIKDDQAYSTTSF